MLYTQCRDYLVERLKEAGLAKPLTKKKLLDRCGELRFGAVLFESETPSRDGSKTIYTDKEGARKKRTRFFERRLTFLVVIGGSEDSEVEGFYEAFLEGLDAEIYPDGNCTPIEPEAAEWVDIDDSILKAKVAVQVKITFHGGLYRDTGFARLRKVNVENVEKANGKEKQDDEKSDT